MSEHESHGKSCFMTHDAFDGLADSVIRSGDDETGMTSDEYFEMIETFYRRAFSLCVNFFRTVAS